MPALSIERTETATQPLEHDIVIDSEEPQLLYGAFISRCMDAAPVAVAIMIVAGTALLVLARRRA